MKRQIMLYLILALLAGFASIPGSAAAEITWSWANPKPQGNALLGIVSDGTQFVAVGGSGTILTSPDGVSWTSQTSGTGAWLYSVTWSGTQFVAVGDNGTILSSPDGMTWAVENAGTTNDLHSVAWNGTHFAAAGQGGTILLGTPDNGSGSGSGSGAAAGTTTSTGGGGGGGCVMVPGTAFDPLFPVLVVGGLLLAGWRRLKLSGRSHSQA